MRTVGCNRLKPTISRSSGFDFISADINLFFKIVTHKYGRVTSLLQFSSDEVGNPLAITPLPHTAQHHQYIQWGGHGETDDVTGYDLL